ncbi:MAG: hypothetical protein ABDK94_02725 [Atribacterota bacterium]
MWCVTSDLRYFSLDNESPVREKKGRIREGIAVMVRGCTKGIAKKWLYHGERSFEVLSSGSAGKWDIFYPTGERVLKDVKITLRL